MARSSQLWPTVSGATLHYAVAVLAVAAAIVGGLVADRVLQTAPFVSLFLCAILFAAWLGGAGPGVLAAGLSTLAFDYYFISPADSFAVQVVPRLGLFAMTALFVIWLSVAQRRTEESLRRARDDLQATVRELEKQNKALQIQDAQRSRAERELQVTIDTIPAIVARYRRDGSPDFVNETWRTYTGLSQDSLQAQRWGVAIHPDDLPKLEAAWHAHLPTAEPFQLEQRMRRADGEYRWHLARRVPHRNEKGEVTGWYGVAHDIEDQRRAQQALHRSESELRDLIETMPAMAVAALPDGSPTFVNRRWTEYTGLSAEDTVGSGWRTAIHPEDFERWLNLWRVCLATGQPFEDEARFRRASDGEYRWFWTRGVPLRDEQRKIAGWYGLGLDIQDRKTAEQQRERLRQLERQAERELQVTIDTIPAIVVRYRRDGLAEFVNQTWRTYTGLSNDNSQGQRWAVAVHPDDVPGLEAAWRSHLATGQPFEMEQRLRRADGAYRWFFFRRVPLRDESGEVIRWYAAAHDIDDQKRAEGALQTAQAELAHVARVSMLGEMSASIAHEVNQPLGAIVTNAESSLRWLSHQPPEIGEAVAGIRQIIQDAHRASAVIRRIREFSKKADPEMTRLDINEVVEEVVTLLRHEALRHGVTMELELEWGLLPVRGDRIQLQQVIINLAVNGMQAMATMRDRERVLLMRTQRQQSHRVLVAVEDVGVGIEPENVDRLFSAFYTTKHDGLGMGLSICRSIIEAHGGRVWGSPNVGPGMTFQFTIPAHGQDG